MGEGVDPTEMCQSLVDKVARSTQLTAIAEPELLVLFEGANFLLSKLSREGKIDVLHARSDTGGKSI